ncbi:MAG: 3-dehydroquinate synthase [Proteobacteria bacterium]|nr:3-dehydroquinate synthase [Pseudomonadota bacterium]
MSVLQIDLGDRSYPIIIKSGYLTEIGKDLQERKIGARYGVIADDHVADLYGDAFMAMLRSSGITAELFTFPCGEASKSLQTVGNLAGLLARFGFDRKDALIGFGGGVTGDLTGFLASAYMRGIPFVQVPTTLLAQVDSSVGGKTGVDIPEGKNLVGAFYQPQVVYIDIALLKTLPYEELLGGLAEVIKYGVIRDAHFFQFLCDNRQKILQLDEEVIIKTVYTCCQIKAEVVSLDEREGGLRRILNYGHTIGHAVEGASDYTIIHGLAVAIGMAAAAKLAVLAGLLSFEMAKKISDTLIAFGMPIDIPKNLDRQRMKKYLLADKKTVGGKVHYVLPTEIGSTCIVADLDEKLVDKVLG